MEKFKAAMELRHAAERGGVISVLALCGPNLRVRLPMAKSLWDSDIDQLNLSVRSSNGLRRAGLDTVGKVSELAMSEKGLDAVRNLGKKSIREIKTALLVLGYEGLDSNGQLTFWQTFVERNF